MKICDACGHVNYSIWRDVKDEPVCNECGATLRGFQCRFKVGEVIGVGCYRLRPATQSDERR